MQYRFVPGQVRVSEIQVLYQNHTKVRSIHRVPGRPAPWDCNWPGRLWLVRRSLWVHLGPAQAHVLVPTVDLFRIEAASVGFHYSGKLQGSLLPTHHPNRH